MLEGHLADLRVLPFGRFGLAGRDPRRALCGHIYIDSVFVLIIEYERPGKVTEIASDSGDEKHLIVKAVLVLAEIVRSELVTDIVGNEIHCLNCLDIFHVLRQRLAVGGCQRVDAGSDVDRVDVRNKDEFARADRCVGVVDSDTSGEISAHGVCHSGLNIRSGEKPEERRQISWSGLFSARIRERALGTEVSEALNPAQQVVKIVNEELTDVLGQGVDRPLNFAKNPPTIIMLAGLQGAGKTTLAGKLGYWLKDSGHTPLLVAADLQRPNAVTQLQVVGERAGVPVYAPEKGVQSDGGDSVSAPGETSGDPVKVARDSIALAKQKLYDTVIIDTAGRLGVDEVLMQQARDIRDAVNPNEILFVIDAMIGQDAVQTAKAFDEGVDFTGVVLSKLDGDARGGAALSVASVTGKPILFASTGEGLKDFEVFHPDRMASRILDMGDILTLIEQAQKQFDEEEARKAAVKISDGSFGLDDFLDQLQQVRKLGPMKNLLGMIPGMAAHRKELEQFDEKEIDRTEAIIRSMTPAERRDPSIIDGSRRARIAYGSGVTVSQVNALLQRFDQAAKMMRRMSNKVGAGVPGFGGPAMGGGKGKGKGKKNKKKSGKSGNPMKREAEEKALRDKLAGKASGGASSGGSAFAKKPQNPALPAGLQDMLGDSGELPPNLGGGLSGLLH